MLGLPDQPGESCLSGRFTNGLSQRRSRDGNSHAKLYCARNAGSVQLALVIPGDHTFANLSPGIITSRKSENGHTTIEATLVPGQSANIWWATREAVTPTIPREVRFLSDAKTLISVSEAEMRIAVLADITVVQGEPARFQVELPAGYEVTGVTGATLDSTETNSGVLTLKVNAPLQRSHQFLISMELPSPVRRPKLHFSVSRQRNARLEKC